MVLSCQSVLSRSKTTRQYYERLIQAPKMNIFQLIADLLHLASILALLYMLHRNKNCYGVSLKTQCLFLTVFCTRYLDLFVYYISLYNETMKILFICATGATVYLMTTKLKASYDKSLDSMKVHYLVAPCFVLALFWNENYNHNFFSFHNIRLVLWAFSQFLEAVAILPQLIMISRPGGNIKNLTYLYIFCMGLYRGLYILNWIYKCGTFSDHACVWAFLNAPHLFCRYMMHGEVLWISVCAGVVQTALYSNYFRHYYNCVKEGKQFEGLPGGNII
jgi:ER lumen protein retaining receptor